MSEILKKTKSGIPASEIEQALTQESVCGMGIDFKKGFITLPDYDAVTGNIIGYKAVYLVNGVLTIQTRAAAVAAIDAFCRNPL